jgi:RNA polymerase primary sigma factor
MIQATAGEPTSYSLSGATLGHRIARSLATLSDLEREVVLLRHGLRDGFIHTLEDVGRRLTITPELTRVIEERAVARLRRLHRD